MLPVAAGRRHRLVREFVCAARDQRADLLEQTAAGPLDDAAWDRFAAEREAMLADFERRLGSERYARLRSVGGVGLLGELLPCD